MNSLVWLSPTLCALLLYGIGQGLVKKNISEVPPARFCLYFVVAKSFVNVAFFALNGAPPLLENPQFFTLGLVAYLLDGAAWILYFESIVAGPITIVGTLSAAYPALTVLFARIFLSENLTAIQYLGIFLIIAACVGLSYSPTPSGAKRSYRWVGLAASALVMWGAAQTIVKFAYNLEGSSETTLAICNTLGGLLTLGIYGFLRKTHHLVEKTEWKRALLPMAMMAAGDLAVIVATKYGPVSVVTPLSGAYPLVTLIFAWFVLKERLTVLHWICVTSVLLGLFLAPGL